MACEQAGLPYGKVLRGVHTPEFDFEHDLSNVRRAIADLQVDFPVVVDNV